MRMAFLAVGLMIALVVAGCTYPSAKGRDLNAEAMQQMGYWGSEPGY